MRILIVGYGKMGRLVEQLALEQGNEVVGYVLRGSDEWAQADVAVDFSTAEALEGNFPHYIERGLPVVIGTTGWGDRMATYRADAEKAGLGVVAAANFSVGVNMFQVIVRETARRMATQADYGAWIHEAHHDTKKDAPSGTAVLLQDTMTQAGFDRVIDISSTRAGRIPGTHTVGFDSASDTIELTHTVRDRSGFTRGALLAAYWIVGRRGWYSMADVLKDSVLE
ncbi:hypothetical protein A3A05_02080 [Candidatus Nomurabacteria bacterium RIFCSPLOWO2_01_FULL_41_12]|uniref:4-hydroxy-tetrahydrodipicolinate reductase n=1 Tax=Candidatus Nomurabacteria bacterium RIFCSPLOWO2_01_FULL_41_12 TaxID=1801774 RepID=A0A1F6WW88_9BACT|nr:MAG: hypothetical protein A3A05_02080 [Candidatus Nomurabacteria bacterium RIFCSPLOWO2_01_FULL_41_12]